MRKAFFIACSAVATPTVSLAGTPQAVGAGRPCDILTPYRGRVTFTMEQRVAMAREEHKKLRAFANAALPVAKTMVLVMPSSGHHTFTSLSFVATRSNNGVWTVSRVGKTTNEFPDMPPQIEPMIRRTLPKDKGTELDTLVADDCLYAQPFMTSVDGLPSLTGWQTALAVITPKRKYAGSAFGPIPSIGGKVVTAVTGW